MFQESNRSEVGRTRLLVALVFSAVGILAVAAASFPGWGIQQTTTLTAQAGPNAAQRQARERYFANKRGLGFGVPKGAYSNAVAQMKRMRPAVSSSANGTAATVLGWTPIGPQPMANAQANFGGATGGPKFNASGRVSAFAIDPQQQSNLYVGAAGGGVWKSTDTGSTFTPIFDAEPT